mmetsp:Transcript_1276/g.2902  ORF Transcript_1276/g.2902 Transcript_1276/m.2902 type:complete len:264 (-) Transcript_1276:345-1136(-)
MSQRGRGDQKSSSGKAEEAGKEVTPVREARESSAKPPAKADSEKSRENTKVPTTPTTPTLEAETTGTDSEHSSEHGRDEREVEQQPRQVIAVSVSKGPSAFFNLARKFLVTDEVCDLSALEGAIVSAVDAAHLLERSKIATITRIQTSYVAVEPKRRKDQAHGNAPVTSEDKSTPSHAGAASSLPSSHSQALQSSVQGQSAVDHAVGASEASMISSQGQSRAPVGTLRRARIIITVRRTKAYEKWLEENPIQDVISSEDVDRI